MLSLRLRAPALERFPGRLATAGPFRLLVGLFLRRFLENDLVSPDGDARCSLGMALALLAAPGVFSLVWLALAYSGPFITPSERLMMALDHKYHFIAASMVLAALAAALTWDSLSLDARDLAVLGPLPIPARRLVAARTAALGLFLLAFTAASNLLPTVGFPVIWLSLVPIGVLHGAWLVVVHGLVSLAAAATGFLAVVGVRSVVLLAGPRLARSMSTAMQFGLILVLATLFLLTPMLPADVPAALERRSASLFLNPSMWLLGGYERLTARGLYANPRLTGEATWRFWQREHLRREQNLGPEVWAHPLPLFKTEAAARRRYHEMMPVLDELAGTGALVLPALAVVTAALYLLACARHRRRERESLVVRLTARRVAAGRFRRLAAQVAVRDPVAQATFTFTLHALVRSGPQRLRVAAALALGGALLAGLFVAQSPATAFFPHSPGPAFLAPQYMLLFLVLVAFRRAFATPADLAASWIFQVALDRADARQALTGVRRAMAAAALPLVSAFAVVHAGAWGFAAAATHFAAGLLLSLMLIEALLYGLNRVPFTWPRQPADDRVRAPLSVVALVFFSYGSAAVETFASSGALALVSAGAAVAAVTAALRVASQRRPWLSRCLTFEEPADGAVTLGL